MRTRPSRERLAQRSRHSLHSLDSTYTEKPDPTRERKQERKKI